jgi:hypothetical protein
LKREIEENKEALERKDRQMQDEKARVRGQLNRLATDITKVVGD